MYPKMELNNNFINEAVKHSMTAKAKTVGTQSCVTSFGVIQPVATTAISTYTESLLQLPWLTLRNLAFHVVFARAGQRPDGRSFIVCI